MSDNFERFNGIRDGAMRRHILALDIIEIRQDSIRRISELAISMEDAVDPAEAEAIRFEKLLVAEQTLGYFALEEEVEELHLDMTFFELDINKKQF